MNIEQIFTKPLTRNINGVVKAEQIDNESAYIELDEYVITRELDRHFRAFFAAYLPAVGPERSCVKNKIGVWVSGFFGSGKSHFIKILSYLLANRQVIHNGDRRSALSFFEDKVEDALLLADIRKAVQYPAEVLLFNIDSRANADDREDAILKVFLKVFNERVGYCADFPHIAHLERELDRRGQYQAFKDAFAAISGSSWETERDAYDFFRDEMAQALSIASGQSEESSRQWAEQFDANFPLDITNFCKWVEEYLDSRENGNILFMVDEVGQFIGKNTQMMLKLQTITENLGTICSGRAWVIVTSQADIDEAIGGIEHRDGLDFSKIQGRFTTRLQLSSSNTCEVIQKRLLTKTESAVEALRTIFAQKGDILRNQLGFDATTKATLKPYTQSAEFVDNYPFVPWHFQLVQKVFESIRTKGATGKHLAMGERSLLAAFQSAAQQVQSDDLNTLIPFWRFYEPIEGFLEPAVKRTIDQAEELGLHEQDIQLLKTLFLIRYVNLLKSTLDNLVTLTIDRIDTDKITLRRQLENSLQCLENQRLIARSGDEYLFLTNEEKEIENEIRNVEVEYTTINRRLSNLIFDDLLKNRKYRYPVNKQDFPISRFCNGHPLDGANLEDLVVKILTPLDTCYNHYRDDITCIPYSAEGNGCILIRLADELLVWKDLQIMVQTDSFLNKQCGQRPEQDVLLKDKDRENQSREKTLRVRIEQLLAEATVYAIGVRLPKKSASPTAIVDEACRYVIENSFAKLKLLRPTSRDINREIHSLLTIEDSAQINLDMCSEECNPEAMREVEAWISMSADYHKPVYLRDVLNHFGRRPFGWPEDEVKLLVARLARSGKINFTLQNNQISLKQAWDVFTNTRRHSELRLLKVRQHDEEQLRKAAHIMNKVAQESFNEREEQGLAKHIRTTLESWEREYVGYQITAQTGQFPGEKEIQEGLQLIKSLLAQKEAFSLVEKVIDESNVLEDFAETRDDLSDFYGNQLQSWQQLAMVLNGSFKANRSALEKDEKAHQALTKLCHIYQMAKPYSQLRCIVPLIEQVQEVNQRLLTEAREYGLQRIDTRIEEVKKQMQQSQIPDSLLNRALYPMQQSRERVVNTQSIPEIYHEQSEVQLQQGQAEQLMNDWIDEQLKKRQMIEKSVINDGQRSPVTSIPVSDPPTVQPIPVLKKTLAIHATREMKKAVDGDVLETIEQMEKALEQLRKTLFDALKAGDRVRLQ
ncbi:BREX system P-loop protein BrxC [Photorhabdus asymbiotica]|uniref:BREX system P-loop protein BrxC n=1 Tax=Photorhabdus asymbiotica TaxID=291112 RepID=UPI003DA719D7